MVKSLFGDQVAPSPTAQAIPTASPVIMPMQVSSAANVPALAPQKPFDMMEITEVGHQDMQAVSGVAQQINSMARGADLDEVGKLLGDLLVAAKGYDPKKLGKGKGISGIFGFLQGKGQQVKNQFTSVDTQVNELSAQLQRHIDALKARIPMMEQLAADNEARHKQMGVIIVKAEERIAWMKVNEPIPADPTDTFAAQKLGSWRQVIQMAEKRVDDLRRVQLLAEQSVPRIDGMKVNAVQLVTKFNDSLVLVIPAWQSLLAEYILQLQNKQSADLQDNVDDAFNEAQKKAAVLSKQNAIQIAKTMSRSVVDTETLRHNQQHLLDTITEVQRIADEGRARLAQERPQLEAMSKELTQKLAQSRLQPQGA